MPQTPEHILADLNPPQREAVETLSGPVLILAGAGSGKTRVVTRRIANLIHHGVQPWQILAITFTNKAAGEMRARVEDLVGQSGAWVATFHSFCARLLRREAPALGLKPEFTIYDEDDVDTVLKEIIEKLGIQKEDKRLSPRSLRPQISKFKGKGKRAEDLVGKDFHERILQQVYQAYEQTLAHNQALDFDDLLLKGVELLRDHADVRDRYRERFKQVLVDEYQDTNGCQYQLVKLLGMGHRNVCATGDPDQSIYAWRGADVQNILSFEKDFPEAKVVRLEQNYRSTKRILAVAQAVIQHNTERKDKDLWTANAEGDKASLVQVGDDLLEAHEVAKRIGDLSRTGIPLGEVAVFYRTNGQSRPLEEALMQSGLPYQLIGGTAFYERREVKDALSYLRLLVNPADDVAFTRVINMPKRGIGPSTIDMIAQQAGKLGVSMLAALDHTEWMDAHVKPAPRKELWNFAKLYDEFRKSKPYPVADVLKTILEKTGLLKSLEESGEDDRADNLDQLVNAAAVHDKQVTEERAAPRTGPAEPGAEDGLDEYLEHRASVAGFLENAALLAPTDKITNDPNRITLMTLHMAKGLEFPYVFLAGLEDGLLPMRRQGDVAESSESNAAIQEERRLFYVGVTRAQKRLCLTYAKTRMRFGRTEFSVPSPFIDEIPENLVEFVNKAPSSYGTGSGVYGERQYRGEKASGWAPKSSGGWGRGGNYGRSASEDSGSDDGPRFTKQAEDAMVAKALRTAQDADENQVAQTVLEAGDRVRHEVFGDGVIEQLQGVGLSAKVQVRFKKAGVKLLLLSLARLQKI